MYTRKIERKEKCDLNLKLIYQSKILKRNLVENCNKQQKRQLIKIIKKYKKKKGELNHKIQ